MEEKTPLSHEVVCFQMLDFGPQNLIPWSQNQIRGKLFLSGNVLLEREPLLTKCYTCTINSSPLLVNQESCYAHNYFE